MSFGHPQFVSPICIPNLYPKFERGTQLRILFVVHIVSLIWHDWFHHAQFLDLVFIQLTYFLNAVHISCGESV